MIPIVMFVKHGGPIGRLFVIGASNLSRRVVQIGECILRFQLASFTQIAVYILDVVFILHSHPLI